MRLPRLILTFVLCLLVAAYTVAVYGFLPLGQLVSPAMRASFHAHRLGIYAHVFGAVAAVGLGPLQFSRRLRQRLPHVHRWMGRVYLGFGVLVGGLAGLFMSMHAQGGVMGRTGFATGALVWLYTGWRAYHAIRAGDVPSHRRWMVRNFALTFAAVTLRIYLPASMSSGIPFDVAYPFIAWLSWAPNLAVAELALRWRAGGRFAAQPA